MTPSPAPERQHHEFVRCNCPGDECLLVTLCHHESPCWEAEGGPIHSIALRAVTPEGKR